MPKVSILVPTYNHEDYITNCLDSLICQETNFEYEILVGEDDSQDKTREICQKYAAKYPDKIRLFLNDRKNVIFINGKPTGRWNLINLIHHASGEYIAICEGDDQYLDNFKLQKQVEFMEQFPHYAMSFHPVLWWDTGLNRVHIYSPIIKKPVYTVDDILQHDNFMAVCSVLYRAEYIKNLPEWFRELPYGDIGLHILASLNGSIGFIDDVMTLYRRHGKGYYSGMDELQQVVSSIQCYEIITKSLGLTGRESWHLGQTKLAQKLALLQKKTTDEISGDHGKKDSSSSDDRIKSSAEERAETDPMLLFEKAIREFYNKNFEKADYYMGLYRDKVKYSSFPRKDLRNHAVKPTFSFVIVGYGTGKDLLSCLQSVFSQSYPKEKYEVIVVDNGKNEEIHSELENWPILWIKNPINLYLSEGRNIGAYFARGDILIFVDDDGIVDKHYLHAIEKAFAEYEIVALRGKVLPKTDTAFKKEEAHYAPGGIVLPSIIDTEGNSAFVRDVYRKVGGMNPLLFGLEGAEISYRIMKYTGRNTIIYHPEVILYHDYAADEGKLRRKESRHQLMRDYLNYKNPSVLRWVYDYQAQFRLNADVRKFILPEDLDRFTELVFPRSVIIKKRISVQEANNRVKFSICIPTHNRAQYLAQALQSVMAQNYRNIEVVIVDDGSTDNTEEVVKSFSELPIRYYYQEKSGAPVARNRLIREAQGEYIIWLDSDDMLYPNIVERYSRVISAYPEADIIYGDLIKVDAFNKVMDNINYPDWYKDNLKLIKFLIKSNQIPNPGTCIKKTAYNKVGFYNTDFPRAHDYEWFSRAAEQLTFKHCGSFSAYYRIHDSNISGDKKNVDLSYEKRIRLQLVKKYPPEKIYEKELEILGKNKGGEVGLYFQFGRLMLELEELDKAEYYFTLCKELAEIPEVNDIISRIHRFKNGKKEVLPENERKKSEHSRLPVTAIISTYNEGDVIYHVIRDLVEQDIQVYLIDHHSTDNTVAEASRWLGKGLIRIETFPEESGFAIPPDVYAWRYILMRKEQIVRELGPGWYIHADADEFRESPFSGMSLREGIEKVDREGYNAINFLLLEFRPTDNSFVPGEDVRNYLKYYDDPHLQFDNVQVKCWKYEGQPFNLWKSGGHLVEFEGRKIYPVPFICRHYPIRSQEHGLKKVFADRKKRFDDTERKAKWHAQYDHIQNENYNFLGDPEKLKKYDRNEVIRWIETTFTNRRGPVEKDVKELTSIVTLTYNQLDYTRQCVDSIYAHTQVPFELIFVDNGSTDGTREWLKQLQKAKDNVRVILNEENKGFPAGCNQGMREARGQYILLLNNDVIVTEGWLERMLAAFRKDPSLGIVGPMTNNISGVQRDPGARYATLEEMQQYAARVAEQNKGKLFYFPRIVGFAMLIKKEVIDKIGYLEETFGSGNYEDDDYCLRAELAGFKAAVVKDAFIHHHGSVSFRADGENEYLNRLRNNSEKFYLKWKEHNPPSLLWHIYLFHRARDYKEVGKEEEALELLRQVFDFLPGEKMAAEEYSALLMEKGKVHESEQVIRRYLSHQPGDPEAWNFLGSLCVQNNKPEEALDAFKKAVELNPGNRDYLKNLIDLSMATEKYEEAIRALHHLLAMDPGDEDGAIKLAQLYVESGNPAEAAGILERAIHHHSSPLLQFYAERVNEPFLFLTYAFIREGQLSLAEEAIEEFLNAQPGHSEGLLLKASLAFNAGRWEEADRLYQRVLSIDQANQEALFYRLKLLPVTGKDDEILARYGQVIRENPDVWKEYLHFLEEKEHFRELLAEIDQFIGKFPDHYWGYYLMGKLYMEAGETDKAAPFLNQALEKTIDSPEVLDEIRKMAAQLGVIRAESER